MVSNIDPTKPADGAAASKGDLRANLANAKSEIEALQTKTQYLNTYSFQGRRNALLNGSFQVAQFNTAVNPVNGDYPADRWKYNTNQAGVLSIVSQLGYLGNQALLGVYGYLAVIGNGAFSQTSADSITLSQTMETPYVTPYYSVPVTLSFQVYTNQPGTYGVQLRLGNRCIVGTYTVSAANTVTPCEINFPAASGADPSSGSPIVTFDLGSGSVKETATPLVWTGVNTLCRTAACSRIAGTSNFMHISQVQLERGTSRTPYEAQYFGDTLRDCQRYYEIVPVLLNGYAAAGGQEVGEMLRYKVTKYYPTPSYLAPTFTLLGTPVYTNCSAVTLSLSGAGSPHDLEAGYASTVSTAAGFVKVNGIRAAVSSPL